MTGKRDIHEMIDFNSLAPCGANLNFRFRRFVLTLFQLTRPVWGEPQAYREIDTNRTISTHSPRVGRTLRLACSCKNR